MKPRSMTRLAALACALTVLAGCQGMPAAAPEVVQAKASHNSSRPAGTNPSDEARLFARLDRNLDDALSLAEYQDLGLFGNGAAAESLEAALRLTFDMVDAIRFRDGRLTESEFIDSQIPARALRHAGSMREMSAQQLLALLDDPSAFGDGDRAVSPAEFRMLGLFGVMRRRDGAGADSTVAVMLDESFAELDGNGDKKLDARELGVFLYMLPSALL